MMRLQIRPVYGLRLIFAFCIMFFHMGMLNHVVAKMVLSAFFVMSGFFMEMHHSFHNLDGRRWLKFELSHFCHFYPIQWLCVVLWLALSTASLSGKVAYHLLLVQSWVPDGKVYLSLNGASWFISTLLFSYLLFPLISYGTKRTPGGCKFAIALCLASLMVYLNCVLEQNYYRQVFPPARVVDFLLGILLCQCFKAMSDNSDFKKWFKKLVRVIDLALVAIVLMTCNLPDSGLEKLAVPMSWIFISIFLGVFTLSEMSGEKCLVDRLLSLKPVVSLGKLSFEIYMIHEFVFAGMKHIGPLLDLQSKSASYLAVGIILLLTVSFLLHYCLVKPVSKRVNKWVSVSL